MKLLAGIFGILFAADATAVEIIAHRGASFDAPENTVAAFKLGWEQGADGDELDIHLTKDGEVVVIHDGNTKRVTGVDLPVAKQTLAELRALDAGSWKDPRWAGEKLPTLPEVLATIPAGKRLFIEVKGGPEILPALEKVLKASGRKPAEMVIIGFSYGAMQKSKEIFPELAVYWLAGYDEDKKSGKFPDLDDLLEKAKAARLDGLDLAHRFPIDTAFTTKVHDAGMKLYAWTVDDAAIAKKLVEAGVDGITTNRPAWLREQLR